MSSEVRLSAVCQGEYQRYLNMQLQDISHPLLQKLASPDALTWTDAEGIINHQLLTQVEQSLQPYSNAVFYGKLIEALLVEQTLSLYKCSVFIVAVKSLMNMVPGLALTSEMQKFTSLLALGTMQATTYRELLQYYSAAKYIQDKFPEVAVEMLANTIKDQCFKLLLEATQDLSVAVRKDQLQVLCKLKDLQVDIDSSSTAGLIINIALCQVLQRDVTDEDKQALGSLLFKLQPELPDIQDLAKELKLPGATLPDANESRASPGAKGSNQALQEPGYITNPSQLKKGSHPISANTQSDPQIFVYHATFEQNGQTVLAVVKLFISNDADKLEHIGKGEARILACLSGKSSYFLDYYGHYLETLSNGAKCFGILMERCKSTLMMDFTDRCNARNPYTETELIKLWHSLTEAFSILAYHKIYHNDVKPHNILVSLDGSLKICDFNISEMHHQSTFTTVPTDVLPIQGTDGYMAPEVQAMHERKKAGQPVSQLQARPGRIDCYGVGLVLLQAAILESISGLNLEENQGLLQEKIQAIQFPWLRHQLQVMLTFDFRQRPSIKKLVKDVQRTTAQS